MIHSEVVEYFDSLSCVLSRIISDESESLRHVRMLVTSDEYTLKEKEITLRIDTTDIQKEVNEFVTWTLPILANRSLNSLSSQS